MKMTMPGKFTRSRKFASRSAACVCKGASILALMAAAALAAFGQARSQNSNDGPVRMARFSYVSGDVSFRRKNDGDWSQAVRNLPVRQGAEISVPGGARAEIQFDDGSRIRLGSGAVASFTEMYSDDQGEYTQITLYSGDVNLRLSRAPSVYQVDAPLASVDVSGPARVRIDANNGLRTSVYQGSAVVQGNGGKVTLPSRTCLALSTSTDSYVAEPLYPQDSFDRWCGSLDSREDHDQRSPGRRYEPASVAIMSDNLDDYGDWRDVPHYGRCWHPHHTYAGWRPYHDGHWTWVDPFGWTWVADEPWGWAPYHYGTWVCESYGWCWVPGPVRQYWSPACVDFYQGGDNVAWCPLAPSEVVYPASLSIGFQSGGLSVFFAIGAAGVYYPNDRGICEARPWENRYVNQVTYVNNFTTINNYYGGGGQSGGGWNRNALVTNDRFIPLNARSAPGASMVAVASFGGRGAYRSLPAGSTSAFQGGRYVGAPSGGGAPVMGPPAVRPTLTAVAPSRSFHPAPAFTRTAMARPVNQLVGASQSPIAARQILTQRPAPAPVTSVHNNGFTRTAPGFSANRNPVSPGPVTQPNRAFSAANQARAALGRPTSTRGPITVAPAGHGFGPSTARPSGGSFVGGRNPAPAIGPGHTNVSPGGRPSSGSFTGGRTIAPPNGHPNSAPVTRPSGGSFIGRSPVSTAPQQRQFTPPQQQQQRQFTPPSQQQQRQFTPPQQQQQRQIQQQRQFTPPPQQQQRQFTPPPQQQQRQFTPPPQQQPQRQAPPQQQRQFTPPSPQQQQRQFTPPPQQQPQRQAPPQQQQRQFTPPQQQRQFTPPPQQQQRQFTPPPQQQQRQFTPPPQQQQPQRQAPPQPQQQQRQFTPPPQQQPQRQAPPQQQQRQAPPQQQQQPDKKNGDKHSG